LTAILNRVAAAETAVLRAHGSSLSPRARSDRCSPCGACGRVPMRGMWASRARFQDQGLLLVGLGGAKQPARFRLSMPNDNLIFPCCIARPVRPYKPGLRPAPRE